MFTFLSILIGFVTGILSGAFGIGGAILSTPALRLILKTAPLIAVGTTLPTVLPAALSGGYAYYRSGLVDWEIVKWCALFGIMGTLIGSSLTDIVSAHYPLIVTAFLVLGFGINFMVKTFWPGRSGLEMQSPPLEKNLRILALTGLAAGLFSGFLGVGGGIILIPAFISLLGLRPKKAFGNSLLVISIIAVPGSIVHYVLGHIDPWIAIWLTAGIIPGARAGSLLSLRARDRTMLLLFGIFLLVVGVVFLYTEMAGMV